MVQVVQLFVYSVWPHVVFVHKYEKVCRSPQPFVSLPLSQHRTTTTVMAFPSVAQYFVVELLSIIFLECLPEEDLQVVRTLRNMRNEAPISVSQVCQHWRYVSFSTHRLWSTLSLSSIEYIRASSRCPSSALQSFLLRSGGTNFHFKITCVNKNLEPGGPILDYVPNHWSLVKPVLDEISGRERIKGLTLRIGISAADPAMEYVIEEFPALEHLSFQTFPIYSRPCQPYTILDRSFWDVASRLVSLELTGVHQFMLHLDSKVMCPNLKYLALNCYFILRELIRVMDFCPVLESLYINFDGPIPTLNEKKPAQRTILRTIRTLERTLRLTHRCATFFGFSNYQTSDDLSCIGVRLKSPHSKFLFWSHTHPLRSFPLRQWMTVTFRKSLSSDF